jgi:O-antigen/teichoic acid export membrane protein
MKFIAVFAEKGEHGKAKALIRDALVLSLVFSALAAFLAWLLLPHFFERFRLANGSLMLLIIAGTALGAVASVFHSAVTALKMFSASVWFSAIAAPLRLLLMLVFMPFRAVSGYVIAQNAAPMVTLAGSFSLVVKWWRRTPGAEPYWAEYRSAILRYSVPILAMTVVSNVSGTLDSVVIRHRLGDFDSAGYYMITRFSEIAVFLGSAFSAFLFPMLAGGDGTSDNVRKLTWQSLAGILVSGIAVVATLALWGRRLLLLRGDWAVYAEFAPLMAVLAFSGIFMMVSNCITSVLTARSCFSFLWWYLPVMLGKSVLLYLVTGYAYLEDVLPRFLYGAIAAFNPCRLSVVVVVMCAVHVLAGLTLACSLLRGGKSPAARSGR